MPIYEYQCKKCGVFEVTRRITEAPLKRCPTCKGKIERLLSRSSFVLKGSGWYATDYAKKGGSTGTDTAAPAASAPANGTQAAATESTAKPAAESKPAAEKAPVAKSAD